ncbi:MAG: SEC-C domain-containing protein [Aldersonia sp.]|nr:SEC-C domain-containing protein [Aldersonia sp.]
MTDPFDDDSFDVEFSDEFDDEFDDQGPDPVLRSAALDILREAGPLTDEHWAARLAEAGHGTVAEMGEFVESLDEPVVGFLPEGRNVALDTLLDGRVFTHRLREIEVATNVVDVANDLDALVSLVDSGWSDAQIAVRGYDDAEFESRGIIDPGFPEHTGLLLPLGTLRAYAAGDVVGFRVAGERLEVSAVSIGTAPQDLGSRIDAIVGDTAVPVGTAVHELLARDSELFAEPLAPLSELLPAVGMAVGEELVARAGFDFGEFRKLKAATIIAEHYQLDFAEADAVVEFESLVDLAAEGDPAALAEAIAAHSDRLSNLAGEQAAAVALESASLYGDFEYVRVAALALSRRGPRRCRPAAHWLAGAAADRLGHPEEAERHYEDALLVDAGFGLALEELAEFASDRGDAERALSLLDRSEDGREHLLYDILLSMRSVDHPELGRNDRCWCGSGRKYKVCHLNKADVGLERRALWLYLKATVFLSHSDRRELADTLSGIVSDDTNETVGPDPFFAVDAALFEGGAFEEFLERRGRLLPEDELALARDWLAVQRSVYAVESVRGEAMTVRDLRTDRSHDVVNPLAVHTPAEGDLFCARVVPAGEQLQILGGVAPVGHGRQQSVLAMLDQGVDPVVLVAVLAQPGLIG